MTNAVKKRMIGSIANYANRLSWMATLIVLLLLAAVTLHPLLFLADRSEWYAGMAMQLNLKSEHSLRFADEAMRLDPSNSNAQMVYHLIHARFFKSKQSEKKLYELYRANQSWRSQTALAYLSIGKIEDCDDAVAWSLVSEGVEKYPEDARFYSYGAILAIRERNESGAIKLIQQGLNTSQLHIPLNYPKFNLATLQAELAILSKNKAATIPSGGNENALPWVVSHIEGCR